MAFEVFKETGGRSQEFISITEKFAFGMSRAFLDKHDVSRYHKAVILFDADEQKVALHFSLNDPKFGFSVRIPNNKHGGTIVAKSFFEKKGIDPKKVSGRYTDYEEVTLDSLGLDKAGKAYVFKLKENEPEPFADTTDEIIDIDDKPIDLSEIPF